MSANLEIRELSDELVVRVTEPRSIQSILLNVSAGAVVAFILFQAFSGSTRIVSAGVIGVILGIQIFSAVRGADVELRVNHLDFVSLGRSPSAYRSSTISRADVCSLEF